MPNELVSNKRLDHFALISSLLLAVVLGNINLLNMLKCTVHYLKPEVVTRNMISCRISWNASHFTPTRKRKDYSLSVCIVGGTIGRGWALAVDERSMYVLEGFGDVQRFRYILVSRFVRRERDPS